MEETYKTLLELQSLDEEIDRTRAAMKGFDPELEELDAPVAEIEREIAAVGKRLEEMQAEARRLERGADEKRAHLKRYEEHLARARTVREEAAARAEIDLVEGAAEADENDAVNLLEQVTRAELKLDELKLKLEIAREETAPRRQELVEAREAAGTDLEVLQDRRLNQFTRLSGEAAQLYERIRAGKTRVAVATLTEDGACGHCFSVIPIQEQNEIRRRERIYRCEACGVILYVET